MRILITGANGQLGYELARILGADHCVTAVDRSQVDLTDPNAIRTTLRTELPDLILNTAAFTNVDGAEAARDLAFALNGTAPAVIAEEAKRGGATVVHFSTDYVFNGTKSGPYDENDEPAPLNVYGKSKLVGEQAVLDSGAHAVVIRTSWVYAARGTNFFLKILALMESRSELRVVSDQTGAPTSAKALATAVAKIVPRISGNSGIYHLAAAGATTWHGFAEHIRAAAIRAGIPLRVQRILPISTAEYGAPALRPANSVLCSGKVQREFSVALADWQTGFADVFEEHLQSRLRSSASIT
jgi:dTDP-4-dehydrorhamnose reductase